MTTSKVLHFTEDPIVDNGIERYEEHEYEPINGTNLNSSGEIRINIEQQDLFTLPSKARITYQLSNQVIEAVYYPGQATTMLGMLNYANDFQLAQGLNQLWYKDATSTAVLADNTGFATRQAYLIQKPTTKGTFSFCVPLRHIFGFCDDYDKIIYGVKHTITLVRQSDDNAIFRLAAAAAGKVNLNKISLFMPNLTPSDKETYELIKKIERKVTIPTSPENPRYVIVGFQTNRSTGDQTVNASIFDHCDLKNMYIMLNNNYRYPAVDFNLSFPNQQISRIYREAFVFKEKFYGMNELIANSNISPSDYRDLYPLFVFDISKQSERLKSSTIQVQIRATFNTAVPANTQAYALVLSDRMMELQSDGNKLNAI
ncbi:uncharacterized protein LOC136079373 [Hydra vulgaris]|uniref:Uncharacterized protein LOC136079373 n=1 Tax=Hydra vulgaris TaxID=6087 RepID=A0ABM4BPX0_HYDVU